MKKETLTLENIKKDLHRVARSTSSAQEYWRLKYITALPVIAVIVGIAISAVLGTEAHGSCIVSGDTTRDMAQRRCLVDARGKLHL